MGERGGLMGNERKGINVIVMDKAEKNNPEDRKQPYCGKNQLISYRHSFFSKEMFYLTLRLSSDLKQYPPQLKICITNSQF